MKSWELVRRDIYVFRDSCNVYAVRGAGDAWLIFNAGTGAAVAALAELDRAGEVTLLLTHHFRDHTAGAERFRSAGACVAAPWHEREHLSGAQRAMRAKQTLLLYDLTWDHFAPISPVTVDRWLFDYEKPTLAGLPVEVVATPGVTLGAVTYAVTLADGFRVAFIGELMGGAGKLSRLSPLQYNYNDLTGVENVLLSWGRVLATGPQLALPSLAEPIDDCAGAVERLRSRAARLERLHPGFAARVAVQPASEVEEVGPRLYRATGASAETHFVVSRTGKVLALDYGYDIAAVRFPARPAPWTRRPLLHSWDDLRKKTGAARIDTVISSHYHDDHIAGVPLLQRIFGTELWAAENFADLLERPLDHDRPCLWPEPLKIARRLPLGRRFEWEDVAITLHPMSGHTEFSSLILLEIDGCRVAHTGDQLFFLEPATGQLAAPGQGGLFSNHVYRNGLAVGCYRDFHERLREFDPELVISGHYRPYRPNEAFWARLEESARTFDEVHEELMELGGEGVHFGADSAAAKLHPYHLELGAAGHTATVTGWVRNPFGHAANAQVELAMARAGWSGSRASIPLTARGRAVFQLTLQVPDGERCDREPIALVLTVEGRCFGQVAEAWVSVS